jgi:transcription antitermination factor NusA-like protein
VRGFARRARSPIVRELNGEKIDIVRWSDDIKQY